MGTGRKVKYGVYYQMNRQSLNFNTQKKREKSWQIEEIHLFGFFLSWVEGLWDEMPNYLSPSYLFRTTKELGFTVKTKLNRTLKSYRYY